MQKRYYLDTCIWLDYFRNRRDRLKPLGEWAFMCIKMIKEEGGLILYSKVTVVELISNISLNHVEEVFRIANEEGFLTEVAIICKQKKEAGVLEKSRGIPFGDALHAVLARDNNAIMITRDIHFEKLMDICKVMSPEELI